MKKVKKKKMKIKLTMVCGYVESDYEEELEELAKEFFWEKFHGSYGYEIIEE